MSNVQNAASSSFYRQALKLGMAATVAIATGRFCGASLQGCAGSMARDVGSASLASSAPAVEQVPPELTERPDQKTLAMAA